MRLRAKIILLAWQGLRPKEIVQQLLCNIKTVYKWINNWNTNRVARMTCWRQTTSWYKQVKRTRALEHLVKHSPRALGLPFAVWSVRTIAFFMKDLVEYPISPTTVWRGLKRTKFSYTAIQDKFIFKDPLYDLKKAQLVLLKHFLPDNFRLVYVDEKGPVQAIRHNGHYWSDKVAYREVRQSSAGKVKFLGAYDPKRDLIYMEPMADGSSQSFCEALTTLTIHLQDYPWRKLIIVLDNASIHHSSYTVDYWAADPRIELFYLPTYSPELNPIESRFGRYCYECLNNNYFTSCDDLIRATLDWCHYYNGFRKEIYPSEGLVMI